METEMKELKRERDIAKSQLELERKAKEQKVCGTDMRYQNFLGNVCINDIRGQMSF